MRLPINDTGNGWSNALPPRNARPPVHGDIRANWLVIGAGYAGIAAARRLAQNQPDARIALVDACAVGDGASARNSGFVIDLPHNVGADLNDPLAQHRSLRLARAATGELDALVEAHKIECQWSKQGQFLAAKSVQGGATLDAFIQGLDDLKEPYSDITGADLAARLGTKYYARAIHTPGTILMQPAALVRGLANSLPQNVDLFENSPVLDIDYGETITAKTQGGTVQADGVILAVNGFAPEFGHYKNRIFFLHAYASMTRPLSEDEHAEMGSPENWGLVPAMPFGGPTIRYTMDRRITMRSLFTHSHSGRQSQATYAKARALQAKQIAERFPHLKGDVITDSWMGTLALSQNFAPGFGQKSNNVFTAVCQNGVGVTKGTISGLLCADLATGRDNDLLEDMIGLGQPSRLPPRPFLDLGVHAKLKLWTHQQRFEA